MKVHKKKFLDYFSLITAILLSGNPIIKELYFEEILLVLFAVFLTLSYLTEILKKIKVFLLVSFLFSVVFSVQIVQFGQLNIITYLGFLTKLYIGYVVFISIDNFPVKYVRVFKWLIGISLLFYIPGLIAPEVKSLFKPISNLLGGASGDRISIFVHTFVENNIRNAGLFWEPGAFAGYIILAIILLLSSENVINEKKWFKKSLGILSLGVLTTLSTMGYIVLIILLISYFYTRKTVTKKRKLITVILLPFFLFISLQVYQSLDFLNEKINEQYEDAVERRGNWRINRFGTLIMDYQYIKRKPITGWGIHSSTRYELHPSDAELAEGTGNGMSDFIAKTGLPSFLIYLFLIYKGFRRNFALNKIQASAFVTMIILLLQGETFLVYPIFLGLYFVGNANLGDDG